MLIPEFKLQQEENFVIVSIRVPYIKVTAAEFYIEEKTFKFYLKPYLLSLSFDQPLKETEEPAKASYNYDKHILTVYLEKKNKNEVFENLNLLSNVLNNKKSEDKAKSKKSNLIEVLNQGESKVVETADQTKGSNSFNYGFCANYQGVFKNLEEQVGELFAFHPKDVALDQRFEFSMKICQQEFDENSYLYDKLSNFEEIDRIVESEEVKVNLQKLSSGSSKTGGFEKFKAQLKIPNKEIIVSKEDHLNIWKQLFAIAFSYVYELLCMDGEMGVESASTINKTCGVFSSNILYEKQSLLEVIYDCCRRCVTYSLYKHLDICQLTVNLIRDHLNVNLLSEILSEVHLMFEKAEPRHLLNRIYMNDYCIYVMSGSIEDKEQSIKNVILKHLKGLTLSEAEFNLDIPNEEMGSMLENESQFVEGWGDNENDSKSYNLSQNVSYSKKPNQQSQDLEKMLDFD